jgi:hypothetical protein
MQLTISPLQQKLGAAVTVDASFHKEEERPMVGAALRCFGNVLICWAHEALPLIASRIIGTATGIPLRVAGSPL